MSRITCHNVSCKKEIKKPILVTNHCFTPDKEVYYACPYCLTKLESKTVEFMRTTNTRELCGVPTEQTMVLQFHDTVHKRVIEKLKSLEKERANLLFELDKLRTAADNKISILEKEVADLREQADILREITAE
jgi:hypothetical protein